MPPPLRQTDKPSCVDIDLQDTVGVSRSVTRIDGDSTGVNEMSRLKPSWRDDRMIAARGVGNTPVYILRYLLHSAI